MDEFLPTDAIVLGHPAELICGFPYDLIECVVVEMLECGAILRIAANKAIPNAVILCVRGHIVMQFCRVLWRKPGLIGVAFDTPP